MRSIPALAWVVLALTACASIAATGDRIISVTQPQFARYSTARQTEINGKLATARFVAYSTAHQLIVGPQGPQGDVGPQGPTGATGPAGTFSRPATFSNISTHAAALPSGGTTGQKLIKSSNASYDTRWETDTDITLSDATPAMSTTSGTAGAGTTASRGDHAHPSDTSRLTVARFSTYSASRQAQFGTVLPLSGGTLTGNLTQSTGNNILTGGLTAAGSSATNSLVLGRGATPTATVSGSQLTDLSTGLQIKTATDNGANIVLGNNSVFTAATGTTGNLFELFVATSSKFSVSNAGYVTTGSTVAGSQFAATGANNQTSGAIYWAPSVTSTATQTGIRVAPTLTATSPSVAYNMLAINPTYNFTTGSTSTNRAVWISPYEQNVYSSTNWLVDAGTNSAANGGGTHTQKFGVKSDGSVIFAISSSPASNAACTAGTITWDASYIYVCTASGAWKRSALTGGY